MTSKLELDPRGTVHGTEMVPVICLDVSRKAAADIADFMRSVS
jgi:hypothetical protein